MLRRYPCVRQTGQSDCGAAALATIALHYRRRLAFQQLRDLAGTDRNGTTVLALLQAAETIGFSTKGVRGSYESLPQVPLPAIAHVKTKEGRGHFVVLYRAKQQAVIVADPAHGIQKLSRNEFCRRWTGYLLLLAPDPQMSSTTTDSSPLSPYRRFLGLLSAHTAVLAEAFCCALLMTVLGVVSSFFIQQLVDSVLVRNEGQLLNGLGIGMMLVLVFRTVFGVLRQYLVAHVSRKVDLALTGGYARHLLRLPLPFFEMRRVGEILSRANDASRVREAIGGATLTALVDGTIVVFLFVVLWLYDLPLALLGTGFAPLLVLSAASHRKALRRGSREAMEKAAHLSAHLVENISGVETVKAFGGERMRADEGETRLVELVQANFSLQKLGISMSTLGTLITGLAGLVVLWYGGHRVINGALTIGQLMFFNSLLAYLLGPLERLASVNVKLQETLMAVDRLYQILDLEIEPLGDQHEAAFQGFRVGLELQDLSFHYGCRANVLEQVTLRFPAGKTVAIVGESGSGKSTLLKLLMGFYEPTAGRILIDGVDMRDYGLTSWRSQIGLVSQEPFIFNGTLRENICLGRPDATLTDASDAARAAGLEEFISSLPERYDTLIGERGANLSGGQRQRLAIARALLRKPELLIFDEATSHLDTATERAIQESLKTALSGKTVVLVAHRLSTIKNADLIYVLRHGRVMQAGTHEQLLNEEGMYRALWGGQIEKRGGAPHGFVVSPETENGHGTMTLNGVSHA